MKRVIIAFAVISTMLVTVAAVWSQKSVSTGQTVVTTGAFVSSDGKMPSMRAFLFAPDSTCPATAIQLQYMPVLTGMGELELTQDQLMQILDVMSKSDEVAQQLQEQAIQESKRLRQVLLADQVTPKQIQTQVMYAEQAEAAVINAEIVKWMQVRSILTPEQLAKLRELMEKEPECLIPDIKIVK
ncbi:MAG TPA: hypothetical protein PLP86_09755 [Armatimonadota bacterium]|nr:hypothetical protein [Armatimonadota bacterium]